MLDDIKKIYRAKYGSELEDDLEENVQKQYRAVVRIASMRLLQPNFT